MSSNHPSDRSSVGTERNAYRALSATLIAGLALTLLIVFPPSIAGAFWPFVVTKAADEDQAPLMHDTKLALLEAAVNPDPNPTKGGIDIAISEGSALVAESGPVGSQPLSSLATKNASDGQISLYVVREGESLSTIAAMFGVSVNTILWTNNLESAKDIHPGDTLLILPVSGDYYTIKKGGTLADVAKLYDISVEEIARFNGFSPNETLAAGTKVIVPGVDLHAGAAPAKAKAKSPDSSSSGSAVATKRAASSVSLGDFANPVPGAYISQGIHGYNGVDLAGVKQGTPVYAATDGKVIAAGNGSCGSGYGICVIVSHPNNVQTLYAHLSSVATSVGATVAKGEHIGGIGNTGRSTGYHLHFEVRGATNPFAR